MIYKHVSRPFQYNKSVMKLYSTFFKLLTNYLHNCLSFFSQSKWSHTVNKVGHVVFLLSYDLCSIGANKCCVFTFNIEFVFSLCFNHWVNIIFCHLNIAGKISKEIIFNLLICLIQSFSPNTNIPIPEVLLLHHSFTTYFTLI